MYSEDCLNYINESILVDKVKNKIAELKAKHAKCKNQRELDNISEITMSLCKKIKNSSLSDKAKKALVVSALGILSCVGISNGQTFADLQNQYNLKQSTLEYEGSGAFDEPDEADIIQDAKYLAVASKGAHIKGIELENADTDDKDEDITRVYNFKDGITLSINVKDAIFVYDNGILLRQYDAHNPAMSALLDVARNF